MKIFYENIPQKTERYGKMNIFSNIFFSIANKGKKTLSFFSPLWYDMVHTDKKKENRL